MMVRLGGVVTGIALLVACGGNGDAEPFADAPGEPVADQGAEQLALPADLVADPCQPVDRLPLEGRPSPYDSTMVNLGGAEAKVCYGRPSARDREIFGGLVPYDTLWRTGANEPTTIHLPFAAEISGIRVEPGSYTLYTVPGRSQWTVIVNRSISQWGIETAYTDAVRAEEVGRAQVPAGTVPEHVETFTISTEPTDPNAANLVLTWERTEVKIPIRRV
jgi:hypothetical protein